MKSILIVEDQGHLIPPIWSALGLRYRVHSLDLVRNGLSVTLNDAISFIKEYGYDLILLDHQLGQIGFNGQDISNALGGTTIKIISISTEERDYAKFSYTKKIDLFADYNKDAEIELIELVSKVLGE